MWIFGDDVSPTLLDAHLVPFIARLLDAGREDLVPPVLKSYAAKVMETAEYQEVTRGRATLWNISYGHVHLLEGI